MFAGDTKSLEVALIDRAGQPVDLAGAQIRWALSAQPGGGAVLSAKTLGSGIVCDAPETGVFTVSLDPADTESLLGNYVHEAEVVLSNGVVSTVLRGVVSVRPTIIKPA